MKYQAIFRAKSRPRAAAAVRSCIIRRVVQLEVEWFLFIKSSQPKLTTKLSFKKWLDWLQWITILAIQQEFYYLTKPEQSKIHEDSDKSDKINGKSVRLI